MPFAKKHLSILPILLASKFSYAHNDSDWALNTAFSTYFTDYVGLFSVTRRLSLKEDPTQPIVDEPEKASDFIYEPSASLNWTTENSLGEQQIVIAAGAYIFQQHTKYTHPYLQLEIEQQLSEATRIKLLYDFIPELYIGRNTPSQDEAIDDADENITSHTWSAHLDQKLTDTLLIRGLVRYGIRLYDQPFSYRDTQFFTVGTHIEWEISSGMELLAGYHFERGYTDGSKTSEFKDDIGYINHYFSTELKIELIQNIQMIVIFDYENNEYTSPYREDLHYQGNENVFQGEVELLYALSPSTTIKTGWQYGSRKFSFERNSVFSNNVWLGFDYSF